MDIKKFKAWAESKNLSTDGETGRNYSYTFYDPKTQAAWDAWKEVKAQAVPEGFVLVPKEPTEKMIDAGVEETSVDWKRLVFGYKAMIEAQEPAK